MSLIVSVKNLSKKLISRTGTFDAVKGINLSLQRGEIFGFLGPNGAGKTTTLSMLVTLMLPDSGDVQINGYDLIKDSAAVRKCIGYVSQVGGSDFYATGRENLLLQGCLYAMTHEQSAYMADKMIKMYSLESCADRLVSSYSGGEKGKLELALGTMHSPKVLFLDEPTTGLDPSSRLNLWSHLRRLREQGMAILMSTHYLEEVNALADKMSIMDQGEIIAEGNLSDLKQLINFEIIAVESSNQCFFDEKIVQALKKISAVIDAICDTRSIRVYVKDGAEVTKQIIELLKNLSLTFKSISLLEPNLNDIFFMKTRMAKN